jgi:hypothetical protein
VNKPNDPPRLFDAASDTTDGVRSVLRSGQRGLPGPSDLARLASRLPLGPLPPPSGSPPAAPPPIAPLRLVAPIAAPSVVPGAIVGALLALGVVGGVWWRDAVSAPVVAVSAPFAAVNGAASIAAIHPSPSQREEPRADRGAPVIAPEAARTPSASTALMARSGPPTDASAAAPRGDDATGPEVEAPQSGALGPSGGAASEDETEVHLLQRAQSALGGNPAAALALTGEHARRFAGGALAQESEFIAVNALLALGRVPEARARAGRLLERFPSSAYRGRLESLGLGDSFQKNGTVSPRTQ